VKAHMLGAFPESRHRTGYRLVLGPLFGDCPNPGALPYTHHEQQ